MTTNPAQKDAGMTMVELIVYISLAVLVTLVATATFTSGVTADRATKARDTATGNVHVISSSIQSSIRNASDFSITGNLLRARVAVGSSGWQCKAWAITPAGALVHLTSATAIAVPGSYTGWTVLADRARGTLSGGQAFIKSANRLEARLEIQVAEAKVPVNADAVAQARGTGSPATCW